MLRFDATDPIQVEAHNRRVLGTDKSPEVRALDRDSEFVALATRLAMCAYSHRNDVDPDDEDCLWDAQSRKAYRECVLANAPERIAQNETMVEWLTYAYTWFHADGNIDWGTCRDLDFRFHPRIEEAI